MRLTWPLIGRSQEMAVIESAISDAGSSGIAVFGAAGVGKSRVAREALAVAASNGVDIRWAVGSASARSLPLGAFAAWVRLPDPGNSQLVHLVRDVIESLTAAPLGTPVTVAVDDAHLLDDLSAFVLHQIVERRAAKVLLTIRSGEPIPVAIQDICRGSSFERLDLQPLSADETSKLLSSALGGSVDLVAAQRLWKLTRGNALYLRNIVEQEVSDGRLVQAHDYWRWTGEPVVPPSLAELIETRMGTLPGAVGDVVDLLAVGEPIDLGSLSRIVDPAAIEEADVRGLITVGTVDGEMEVRLAHPLYGELRRKRAAATRLRRLRARVATELAASDGRDEVRTVVRRAVLTVDSDLAPEPELLLKAAEGAMFLADAPLADRLAFAAIRAGAGVQAYNIRSFALAWQGRGEEADAVVASTPIHGLAEADRVYLLGHRGFNKLWGLADPDGAKQHFDEAARIATSSRSWIDAYMTIYWASMAKPGLAMHFGGGLNLEELPGIISSAATWALIVAHGDSGRPTEADHAAEVGDAYAARVGTAAHMRLLIVDRQLGAVLQCGRLAEANLLVARARQQTADVPGVAGLLSTAIEGRAALGSGRLGEARSLLKTVVALFVDDSNGFRYRYLIPFTTALAMSGLSDEASEAFTAVEAEHHRSYRFVEYERDLAHAWLSACQGAVSEALAIATVAAEKTRTNGQFAAEVVCLQTAAQLGDGSTAARLRELTEMVEGPRVAVAARFAGALAAGDGDELASASTEFEAMGDVIAALDAAAHAAIAYRHKGLRGSALGCSTRADALAERCGGASTPALRQASMRLPFTMREQEIVTLLGDGLSSRAVAERLTLSVRTVEGHIYRAMTKTGVSSREELASLLRK